MKSDKLRMIAWLGLAVIFYAAAILVKDSAQFSTGLWKAGHVTAGGYLGYWIDRHRFGRILGKVTDGRMISSAIIIAASILGLAFGL